MRNLSAFLIGLLFGLGLVVSQMVNPAKVIGFLDVAGAWDPTLLVVMAAALAVSFAGYRLVLTRAKPLLETEFTLPTKTELDRPLIVGAALFGLGWGLVGFCPGPAVTAAGLFRPEPYLFLAAMFAGMWVRNRVKV